MASLAAVVAAPNELPDASAKETLAAALGSNLIAVAAPRAPAAQGGLAHLNVDQFWSPAGLGGVLRWFEQTSATHLLLALSPRVEFASAGLRRLAAAASDSQAAVLYSDYLDRAADGATKLHPLVDYQPGSLRDDFDFGQAVVLSRYAIAGHAAAIEADGAATAFGAWYDLRLRASERGPVVRLPEPTYVLPPAPKSAGDGHFAYVDPRNRDYQVEMERIATAHLRRIGAFLEPPTGELAAEVDAFAVEASVVIPVRNRERTVAEAVGSALAQAADFPFNVIVVDNHSTDGTTRILAELAASDPRLVHLVPNRTDLGIGGCWNEAVYSPHCGRYAVQLDSDDLYSTAGVLQRVVAEFRRSKCAMVVGSYTIVNFDLQPIPPGLIDHREWSDANGHNNALRIHGLGAPRAFHVPTLRTIGFPNASYGEDYAVAVQLTRRYPLGRIYDSLYWCRRWEDNTDHDLPLETKNRYALYKDRLRSLEIAARQALAKGR